MPPHVGFLRAVNVGKRRVAMSDLVEAVEGVGFSDVWTYINSGNVVFSAPGKRVAIEAQLEATFEKRFGFVVETFVRSVAEIRSIAEQQPFDVRGSDTHFITLTKHQLDGPTVKKLEALSNDYDTLLVVDGTIHWRMHGSSMDTRLKARDWALVGRTETTSRNMTMVRKLVAQFDKRGV